MEKQIKKAKSQTLLMHVLFPLLVIGIVVLGVLAFDVYYYYRWDKKAKIVNYVKKNSDEIISFINGDVAKIDVSDLKSFDGVKKQCNDDTCFYEFQVSSTGLSIGGCYIGFYYTEDDIIHKYNKDKDRYIVGNIDSYEVTDGSEYLRVEKIKDNFYYFADCFN